MDIAYCARWVELCTYTLDCVAYCGYYEGGKFIGLRVLNAWTAPTFATWPQLERHYLLEILKYFVKIFVTIKIANIIYCADPS